MHSLGHLQHDRSRYCSRGGENRAQETRSPLRVQEFGIPARLEENDFQGYEQYLDSVILINVPSAQRASNELWEI